MGAGEAARSAEVPAADVELSELVGLLAGAPLPLEIGHFDVDERGKLLTRMTDHPILFTFDYAGFHFEGRLQRGDAGRIDLSSALGVLPYTAEQPWGRAFLARLLERSAEMPSGRLELAEDGVIRMAASKPSPEPCTAVSVMAVVTALLLEFRPYAEVLRYSVGALR